MLPFVVRQFVPYLGIERFIPMGRSKNNLDWQQTPREFKASLKFIEKNRFKCNDPLYALVSSERKADAKRAHKRITGGCSAGIAAMVVSPTGTVFPCAKLRIPAGNIHVESLETIWLKSGVFNLLRNRENISSCRGCDFLNDCGGCRSAALAASGDWLGKDPLCFKELIRDES